MTSDTPSKGTDSGDLTLHIPRRPKIGIAAVITLLVALVSGVAKATFHVAGVDTRLGVVEVQVLELRKDGDARELRDRDTDARGRRMELILCRLCAKDPACKGACGDQ